MIHSHPRTSNDATPPNRIGKLAEKVLLPAVGGVGLAGLMSVPLVVGTPMTAAPAGLIGLGLALAVAAGAMGGHLAQVHVVTPLTEKAVRRLRQARAKAHGREAARSQSVSHDLRDPKLVGATLEDADLRDAVRLQTDLSGPLQKGKEPRKPPLTPKQVEATMAKNRAGYEAEHGASERPAQAREQGEGR